jgi:hypothetical protein
VGVSTSGICCEIYGLIIKNRQCKEGEGEMMETEERCGQEQKKGEETKITSTLVIEATIHQNGNSSCERPRPSVEKWQTTICPFSNRIVHSRCRYS